MHIVRRHTLVGVVMACTVLVGVEGHHILTKGTPTQAYQCKHQRLGVQGQSCTTLQLSCSPCTWNNYSTPAATGRLQSCSHWHVAGIYKQLQLPSCQEMKGRQDSHRKVFDTGHSSHQMRRVCAVSFSDFLDCVLVAARRTHGALWGLLLGGSLRLASFPCSI